MIEMRGSSGPEPVVSVIVVHHGDSDAVYACVESVCRFSNLDFPLEIILVENGVYELVRPRLGPGVLRVRTPGGDRGYAAAVNEGAACARAPYLLFLDPAAYVSRNDVEELVRALRNDARVAGVAPVFSIVDEAGRLLKQRRSIARLRSLLAHVRKNARLQRAQRFVRWAPATSLLVRAEVFRALGGVDEAFVTSGADEDWCLRARRRGYEIALLEDVNVRRARRAKTRSHVQRDRAVHARLRIAARHAGMVKASLYACMAPVYLAWVGFLRRISRRPTFAARRSRVGKAASAR